MKQLTLFLLLIGAFFSLPSPVFAHAFGAVYTLPIPFWLYLYGAAGALLLSFLLLAFFYTKSSTTVMKTYPLYKLYTFRILTSPPMIIFYKTISIFLFFLTLLSSFIGEDLSAFNFSMPFFWIIFVIGFTYLTFFLGDIWEVVNPWKILVLSAERLTKSSFSGYYTYPKQLGYWPAFVFYLFFIGVELFGHTTPFTLGVLLMQYSVMTFFGVLLYGSEAWFRYGEFFSVFFRLVSLNSPIFIEKKRVVVGLPFMRLMTLRPEHISLLLFVLFMLSSTAFDGLRETNAWYLTYWDFFKPLFSLDGFFLYEIFGLVLSPFFFLCLYLLCIGLMKLLTGSGKSIKELSLLFCFSLLPIALVYNIAHYFSLLVLQGPLIIRLLSDPFGWGWNLIGTNQFVANQTLLDAAFVWHFQIALILTGHIISVFVAHGVAVKLFKTRKKIFISQLPMLMLMILYTVIGLWILSQPIGATG